MAKLNKDTKAFIVQRLACFDTPSDVAAAVKEEFGIEVSRAAVQCYDPTKVAGANLAKTWKALFEQVREKFLSDTSDIAASHKAVRVARLERMANAAERRSNYVLAASLLEQIAKEMGDQYTNLRRVAPTTPDGKEQYDPAAMGAEERRKRIAELEAKLGRGSNSSNL